MIESIDELRRICQSREDQFYQMGWVERNILRRVSIYFTKFFLIIGASANQVTSLSFLIAIIGGVFLTFANPIYWIIGALLLLLFTVLDLADGEVARYRGSASPSGAFWDAITGLAIWQYTLACMSFGIYHAVHNITVFIWGFLAIVSLFLYNASALITYPILHEKGLLSKVLASADSTEDNEESFVMLVIRRGRRLLHPYMIAFAIVVLAIIDYFISPIMIGSFSFDARYIYLAIYALATLAGASLRIYSTLRGGVKLRHFG